MEEIKEQIIKAVMKYLGYLPAIFIMAGLKFFYNKTMGKKLGFWGNFHSYWLTVLTGIVALPIIHNLPEPARYVVLMLITLLAKDFITWIYANWKGWWEHFLRYKRPDDKP